MTKVLEIIVPAQKNAGGLNPWCNNATIHGNDPRWKLRPATISPVFTFGTPQVSEFLRDRLNDRAERCFMTAHATIRMKIFLIIVPVVNLLGFPNRIFDIKTTGFQIN